MTVVLPPGAPASPASRPRPPAGGRRPAGRRVAATAGALLVLLGAVVLLLGAYLLWGTSLVEGSHQHALQRRWAAAQARARQADAGDGHATGSGPAGSAPLSGVQAAPAGPPPAVGQPVGTISIPAIGVWQVVVQGTGTDQLRQGPGHYPATPMPGQPGNAAIAGHRTTYAAPFFHLDALGPGDAIYVTTVQGRFRYDVVRSFVVAPSDVAVVGPSAVPELTLTTCNPRYSAAQRLVVQAVLVGPPAAAGPTAAPAVGGGPAGGDVAAAAAWGSGWALVTAAAWGALRRRRWRWRWAVGLAGAAAALAVLLGFFAQLAPLLPASF